MRLKAKMLKLFIRSFSQNNHGGSMIRDTSRQAYNTIKKSGLMGALQFKVYDCVYSHGPLTQGEAWKLHFNDRQRHDVCPRFAELEHLGVIKCVGERPCRITGKNSMTWDITGTIPVKTVKKTKKDEVEEAILKERKACAQVAWDFNSNKIGNAILNRGRMELF